MSLLNKCSPRERIAREILLFKSKNNSKQEKEKFINIPQSTSLIKKRKGSSDCVNVR